MTTAEEREEQFKAKMREYAEEVLGEGWENEEKYQWLAQKIEANPHRAETDLTHIKYKHHPVSSPSDSGW